MNRSVAILASVAVALIFDLPASATTSTWTGTTSADWFTGSNWGGTAPGSTSSTSNTDTAVFNLANPPSGNGTTTPVFIDPNLNVQNITFDTNAGAYVIGTTGGNTLTLTAGGAITTASTLTSGNIETVNAPLTLVGNYTFNSNSSTLGSALQIGGYITSSNVSVLTLTGSNTSTKNIVSGQIDDQGGFVSVSITKTGTGYWDLTGTNTISTEPTTISGGTLSIGNNTALGTGLISLNGGSLAADMALTSANALSNSFVQGTAGTAASVTGTNSIATSGTLTFSPTSTNATTTTPSVFGNNMTGGATFSTTGTTYLSNGAASLLNNVIFSGTGNTSLGAIAGNTTTATTASILGKYGTGTLTLDGQNSATGAEQFYGGTVVANEGAGATKLLGTSDALTLGSNLILSGGTGTAETVNGTALAGSGLGIGYSASISATNGNTINLGVLSGGNQDSVFNFQPGVALTTTPSGAQSFSTTGTTSIYGGWAVAGTGATEDFAANLTASTNPTAIVGLPIYDYALGGGNGPDENLAANIGGATITEGNGANFALKIDGSNSTAAGNFGYTRTTAPANFSGSEAILYTGFANVLLNGDIMNQAFSSNANDTGLIYLQQYGSGTLTIANNIYGADQFTYTGTGNAVGSAYNPVNALYAGSGLGGGTLVKGGPGTVILTGTNNYVGNTYIDGGTLSISSDSNLGGVSGQLSVTSSSTASTSVTVTGVPIAQIQSGATFLGSTILRQSISSTPGTAGGTVTLTLAGNANQTISAATNISYANGQQTLELNGGTLQATNSFTLGEIGGTGSTAVSNFRPITLGVNGGTIDVTSGNTLTVPGVVSATATGTGALATGAFTKTDSGTLVFAGANTYTGGTTVNGGTLNLNFGFTQAGTTNFTAPTSNILASTGAVTLGGGTLSINGAASAIANSQTIASLALSGGSNTIALTPNSASSVGLTVTNGNIARTVGSTIDFIPGTNTSVTLTGNANNSFLGASDFYGTGTAEGYAATSSAGVVQAATTTAATTASNFNSATTNYTYAGAGGTDSTAGSSATANTVAFNTTAPQTIALGTNALTLNGLLNNGSALTISGTSGVNVGSSNELVIGGSTNVSISAPIKGTGGALTDSNTATVALSGANTYTGPTTVNTGTLSLTGGSLTGSNVTAAGTGVFSEASGATINGTGATFTQASTGTSTLAGTNTYTGLTTVSSGELDFGNSNVNGTAIAGNLTVSGGAAVFTAANPLSSASNVVVSGGTLNLNGYNQSGVAVNGVQLTGGTIAGGGGTLKSNTFFDVQNGVISANLAGTTGLTKSTGGVVLLSGANTYTGTTTINGGILEVSSITSGGNLGSDSSAVVLGGGTLSYNGANASFTRGFTLNSSSEIDSSASGTLTVATGAITGSTATLTIGGIGSTTVSSNITTTTGGLNVNQFGTLTLSGANTFAGVTTINNGILNLGSNNALGGGGNITFNGASGANADNSGVLQFSANNVSDVSSRIVNSNGTAGAIIIDTNGQDVTFASVLNSTNTGGLQKTYGTGTGGTGILTLTGANTYTGTTTVSGGTLSVSNILSGTSNLGTSTSAISLNGGDFSYTGAAAAFSRGFTLGFASEIDSAAPGTGLTIQTANITGAFGLTFGGTGNTTVTSVIGTGAGTVTKIGAGTLIAQNANTYTGITSVDSGTFQVGNGTTGTLSSGDAVTFNGTGLLNFKEAASATQNLSTLTLTSGDGTLQSTYGGSGTTTNNLTTTSRAAGATVNFVLSGGTAANNLINVAQPGTSGGGSFGDGYFFGGSSYAVDNATLGLSYATSGAVRAINYGTDPGTLASNTSSIASISNTTGTIATETTTVTSLTGSGTTSASPTVTVSSTTGLAVGQPVSGTGIPAGAYITAVGSGQVTISANATATGSITATFGTNNTITVSSTTGLVAGEYVSGTGIPANSYITSVGSGTITINQYVTTAGTGALTYTTNPFIQTTANVTAQANGTSFTDVNLSGTPNFTLASGATVKIDGILKSGTGLSTISGGTALQSVNSGDEFVFRTDQATDALTISTNITANGTNALTKSGAGTLTLSGANTITGTTTVNGGTLSFGALGNLGNNAGATVALNGGDLSYTGSTLTIARPFTVGAAGGEVDTTTSGQTLTISNTTVTSNAGVATYGGAGNTTVGGVISGTGGVNANSTGIVTLGGVNTYIGPTTVNAGRLNVTGTIGAISQVTVGTATGSTVLGGTGTILGPLATQANSSTNVATISPGVGTAAGTLTLNNSLSLGSGSALTFSLATTNTIGGGTNSLIAMNGGTLSIGGTITVNLTALGSSLATGSSNPYTLISDETGIGLTSNLTSFSPSSSTVLGLTPHFEVIAGAANDNVDVYFTSATGAPVQTLGSPTPTAIRIMAGSTTTVPVGATLGNTAGTAALTVNLSSTGTAGTVTVTTPTNGATVAAGGSTTVSGTYTAGSVAGSGTWQLTNTDSTETPTTVSTGGTVTTYSKSTPSLSASSVSFGAVHQNATGVTVASNLQNAAGTYVAGLQVTSLGSGLTGPAIGTVIAQGGSSALTGAVNTSTVGSTPQTYAIGTSDDQTITGASANGTTTLTATGQVYSGQGVYIVNGSGAWGTPSLSQTSWTANGGVPGLAGAPFNNTDSASFGTGTGSVALTANSGKATVSLNGDAPMLNAITLNAANAGTSYQIGSSNSDGTITLNGNGAAATVLNSAGANSIAAQVSLGTTYGANFNVSSGQSLTMAGQVTGGGKLTANGAGALVLSSANSYSGGTAVTGGSLIVNGGVLGTSSGTGGGTVAVTNTGSTLAGTGAISGAITLGSGTTLYSGGLVSGQPSGTLGATSGLKVGSSVSVGSANLTFALSTNTNGSGVYNFNTPSSNSTILSLANSASINFTGTDSITLVDTTNGGLALNQGIAYQLVVGTSNSQFSGLITELGTGANAVYSIDGTGYVVGVLQSSYAGGTTAPVLGTDYTAITINEVGSNGVSPLTGPESYTNPVLYLNNGDLEVVPEPGTWALMLGGLALLVFIQRNRGKFGRRSS